RGITVACSYPIGAQIRLPRPPCGQGGPKFSDDRLSKGNSWSEAWRQTASTKRTKTHWMVRLVDVVNVRDMPPRNDKKVIKLYHQSGLGSGICPKISLTSHLLQIANYSIN